MMKRWVAYICLCAMLLVLPMAAVADATPTVTITFDRDTVAVGELVTATYKVTGDGEYENVFWDWNVQVGEYEWQGHPYPGSNMSESMKGTVSLVPKFGSQLEFNLWVVDKNGRTYGFSSDSIVLTGDESKPPYVTVVMDKSQALIGEMVTATYEVTGDGEYENVFWDWNVQVGEYEWQGHPYPGSNMSESMRGTVSLVPKFGSQLEFNLWVVDKNGRTYGFSSDSIVLTGDESKPPYVTVVMDKSQASIGEMVTATYEVTGDGEYENVFWDWNVQVGEYEWQGHPYPGSNMSESMKGTVSLVPKFGSQLEFNLWVVDKNGRTYGVESDKIILDGFVDGYDTYEIIKGADTQITTGAASLTFCSDGDFEKFLDIQVDGAYVPKDAYTAWAGSTYVELSAGYLNTLSDGQHELTVIFDDGIAVTGFTVDRDANKTQLLPQTGDHSHLALWLAVLTMAGAVMLTLRRKAHN